MTEAQKCLYHIAENMRMDKSISKEGYEYFQQAIKALEQQPSDDGMEKHTDRQIYDGCIHLMKKLPTVTPKPKTGHWELVQRGKSIDVCCSNCKAVRIKGYAYGYTIDQLDKEYVKERFESDDMRYCPYCGSDNREVEG